MGHRRATEKNKMQMRLWIEKHPHHNWAKTVINGHRARGIDVRITSKELEELAKTKTYCAYCETPLNWVYGTKKGRVQATSPTADRLNNEKFIDRDNIRIVCYRCNTAKGEGTLNEFISYCKRIVYLSNQANLPKTTSN